MCTQTLPKRLQADVFEHFSYYGVKLLVAYHAHTDMPKTSAGRRFKHFPFRSGDTAPRTVQTLPKRIQTDRFRSDLETRLRGLSKPYRNGLKRIVFGPIRRHGSAGCPSLTETVSNGHFSIRSGDTAPRIVQTLPKRTRTEGSVMYFHHVPACSCLIWQLHVFFWLATHSLMHMKGVGHDAGGIGMCLPAFGSIYSIYMRLLPSVHGSHL